MNPAAVASAADDAAYIGPGPRAAAMAGVGLPGTEVDLESSGRLASAGSRATPGPGRLAVGGEKVSYRVPNTLRDSSQRRKGRRCRGRPGMPTES